MQRATVTCLISSRTVTRCGYDGAWSAIDGNKVRHAAYLQAFFSRVSGVSCVFFFFQAEDGIRDGHVTGVQTCALPILADDVAATKRAIAMQDGPVILVGHSWAGMVISEAGNDPKVTALVYVAAIVPDENQSANDVLKPYSPPPGLAEAKPDAAGFLSLSRKGIDEDFVPDLPPAERAIVYATQGPWNSACLADKVSVPAWTTKP